MDDLAHRKRKSDQKQCNPLLYKRARLDKLPPIRTRRLQRRSHQKSSPVHTGTDIEDIGIVTTADPGPSTGSLLRRTRPHHPSISVSPVDLNSIHIPPLQPLINRQTLKELDLDAILRNPQLRHDLLFDPGLQFRPTCSRRKREMAEKYWAAITTELQSGCTCVSFLITGKPSLHTRCICATVPLPAVNPTVLPHDNIVTVRMPSRIRPLLDEFLEVLLLVIQPLSPLSDIYVNPNSFKSQMQEHSAQAAYIRSVFDPALIEQELRHDLFDPSGLFRVIGNTLKGHCAPMRDRAVEQMVLAAQACSASGPGTKAEAVRAVRMCLEILELMKLDIANHQLQTLRPFLIRTSGQLELKTLRMRTGGEFSLHYTREWLHTAHQRMLARRLTLSLPQQPQLNYDELSRNQHLYLAVLCGLVDLVFKPPPAVFASHFASSPSSPTLPGNYSPPVSPIAGSNTHAAMGLPETLYLDHTRLLLLSSEATDATAVYMFLLLYRQLVHSSSSSSTSTSPTSPTSPTTALTPTPRIEDVDLLRLKREIRDICTSRLGSCFSRCLSASADHLTTSPASANNNQPRDSPGGRVDRKEIERWRGIKKDIVLQVARRAWGARCGRGSQPASPLEGPPCTPFSQPSTAHPPPSPISPTTCPSSPTSPILGPVPSSHVLGLAQRWADTNMQAGSALSAMLHNKVRDAVLSTVVGMAYPPPKDALGAMVMAGVQASTSTTPITSSSSFASGWPLSPASSPLSSTPSQAFPPVPPEWSASLGGVCSAGMEPLADEIRSIAEKIARLGVIHLNAYLPLYERDGFLLLKG